MIELDLPGAKLVFTTRQGGQSSGPYSSLNIGRLTGDDPASVERNIQTVKASIGPGELQLLEQVHGSGIHVADAVVSEMPQADAAITSQTGIALAATGADCPPVALSDGERVAIVHCGWRSVAAGLIEKTTTALAQDFHAAIGPGICQEHFEVGPEVIKELGESGTANALGRQLDLRGVIADRLRAAGVNQLTDVDRCTFCEPKTFFSHRRDNGVTGRQAGIVWRS